MSAALALPLTTAAGRSRRYRDTWMGQDLRDIETAELRLILAELDRVAGIPRRCIDIPRRDLLELIRDVDRDLDPVRANRART